MGTLARRYPAVPAAFFFCNFSSILVVPESNTPFRFTLVILTMSSETTLVLTVAAVAVGSVLVYLLFCKKSSKKKQKFQGDTILFLGNSGTGKTLLFSTLFHGARPATVNSLEEEKLESTHLVSRQGQDGDNAANSPNKNSASISSFNAVCLPGNLRLRSQYRKHLTTAAGIVLVLDACEPDVKGTAAFLHELLVNPVVDEQCPPILIACAKNDVAGQGPGFPTFVMQKLEAELDIVKRSQNSGMSHADYEGIWI